MRRCVFTHRFLLFFILSFYFDAGRLAAALPAPPLSAATLAKSSSAKPLKSARMQETQPQSPPPESTTSSPSSSTTSKTDQYILPHDKYEKAIAYSRAEYVLYFVSYFLIFAIILLILRLGLAAKFRDIAERVSERKWLQGLIFVPLLILTVDVFDLPLRVYWHGLSLRYEQSVQSWGSWIWDWSKEELLQIGFALILVLVLYFIMHRSPRRWWLYFWFAALPILLFTFFITPWFIDPMFHKFEPLVSKEPDLVVAIQRLSNRAGVPIPPDRMFLMEASQKTNAINAYVTGVGASKRVVIWDTTIQKMPRDEVLYIVGHEFGHYVLGHIRNGFLFFSVSLLVALYLIFRGLHWALDHWGHEWKIYGAEDWASLAIILLLFNVVMFFSSPIVNGFSRAQEHAADVYGLELIHGLIPNSEEVAARAFQALGEIDLSDPNPPDFITFWLYSHPPLAERLVFAHSYDPWSKGESPKYVK